MSIAAPVVTPSSLVLEKEQVVVIEFRREIPKNSFLTLDIYYDGESSKFTTLPTALLGPRTVRAMFPVFPKPGIVNITVLLARDEDSRFPQFRLKVQSPIEALASSLPACQGSRLVAMLAAAVAYLANCDEKDREATMNADETISEILKAIQPADLPEWILAWLLCGKFSPAENLLHVCTRQRLSRSLDILLQPWFIEERAHYLLQKGPDNKTPVEIAKKQGLVVVSEVAEQLTASGIMKLSTPKSNKKKFNLKHDIPRASSIDSNLHYYVQDSPTSPVKKKDKGKGAKRMLRQLFKSETKEKINVPAASQQAPVEELPFGGSSEDMRSATLPQRNSIISSAISIPESGPASVSSVYSMAGKDESTYEQKRLSRTLPRLEQPSASSKPPEHPSQTPPPSARESMHMGQLQVTEHRGRPVSSLSSGYGSAVSNAVAELKEKAIYKAEVVRQYKWASSTNNDFVLQVGDKVYVTQEIEDNMCVGVCNDHYCKFPKSILCILSGDDVDDVEDEHDYDRVSFTGASDDDDDGEIYKIPRNVPRVASSDSDSDGSDHIYDVPPNREDILDKLITEGHYMKVPTRNTILESILSGSTQLEDHSTVPQTTIEQQQLRGEREIETSHEQSATLVSRATPQGESNRAEQQQKERVTEVYIPEESEKEDTDGIYDVPSSVLRSIHDTIAEEQGSEYDQLIPLSSHSAKIADESQRVMPNKSGWGYAEIKDAVPSASMATTQVLPHQDSTHSTNRLHYADITDAVPSKQAPFVKQLPNTNDTPNTDLTIDVHGSLSSDIIASLTERSWNSSTINKTNSEEKFTQSSVIDSECVNHMESETPTSSTCQVTELSSETSDLEDGRNMATPEGSEGSDVFIDQPSVTMTAKSNSLPPLTSHRIQSGGGYAMSPQKGATMATSSPRQNRPRIVSEPQAISKPKPAKRTKISNDQPPPPLTKKPLPQLAENYQVKPPADLPASPHEIPPPALPEKPQPPPVLPEKPPPPLHEKPLPQLPEELAPAVPEKPLPVPPTEPPPVLPDKPPPVLPDKPPPVLADKPPPVLPDKPPPVLPDKPPPVLPDKPLPVLPDKPPPVLPDKPSPALPVWETTAALAPPLEHQEQSPNATEKCDSPAVRKSPKPLDRPPVPKPRRNLPSTSGNSPIQVRSGRSHTTATCTTVGLNGSSMSPSHQSQEANRGSPKALRSTRTKSSSDSQRFGTSNGSGFHGQSSQHLSGESTGTTAYEGAFSFKDKAKAAAPPVARKPKHTPSSSPGRREQPGPPTSPKPKRK